MTLGSVANPPGPDADATPMRPPRRIFIIGGPCSGKTHLAWRLASRLGLEHIELDQSQYQVVLPGNEGSHLVRLERMAATLAAREAWVIEGNYIGWTGAFLEAADAIVWTQVRLPVAIYRIFRRYLGQRLRGQHAYPGAVHLIGFCRYTLGFYRAWDSYNIATLAAALRPFDAKVIARRDERDVRRLIETLEVEPAWR